MTHTGQLLGIGQRHFSEGWWLSRCHILSGRALHGCTSQVSWVQNPSDCQPFHFPLFCLITFKNSSILANSHSYLNYFFCILVCNDLAYHNHGEERLSVMEGPQSHSKEDQVRKQECMWQPVKGKSTENKVNRLSINTVSLSPCRAVNVN